jgi:cytochrome c556
MPGTYSAPQHAQEPEHHLQAQREESSISQVTGHPIEYRQNLVKSMLKEICRIIKFFKDGTPCQVRQIRDLQTEPRKTQPQMDQTQNGPNPEWTEP